MTKEKITWDYIHSTSDGNEIGGGKFGDRNSAGRWPGLESARSMLDLQRCQNHRPSLILFRTKSTVRVIAIPRHRLVNRDDYKPPSLCERT